MTGQYKNISIHIPEDFVDEFERFERYIKYDIKFCDDPKARKGQLVSFAIRKLIASYNKNFREKLLSERAEKEGLKGDRLNSEIPQNVSSNKD